MGCCNTKHGRDFDPNDEGLSCEDIARYGGDDIACPVCGEDVYHDAAMCHACGYVIEHEPAGKSKAWIVITIGVVVVAFGLVTIL